MQLDFIHFLYLISMVGGIGVYAGVCVYVHTSILISVHICIGVAFHIDVCINILNVVAVKISMEQIVLLLALLLALPCSVAIAVDVAVYTSSCKLARYITKHSIEGNHSLRGLTPGDCF